MLAGIEFTYNVDSKNTGSWFSRRSQIVGFLSENSKVVSDFYKKIDSKTSDSWVYSIEVVLICFLSIIPLIFVVDIIKMNIILSYILTIFMYQLILYFLGAFTVGVIIFIISREKLYDYFAEPKKMFPLDNNKILKYYYQFYKGVIKLNKLFLVLFVLYLFFYSIFSFLNNDIYFRLQILSTTILVLLSFGILFLTRGESTDFEGLLFSRYIINQTAEVKIKLTVHKSESIVKIIRLGSALKVIDEKGFIEDIPYNKIERISVEVDKSLYNFFSTKITY